MPGRPAPMREEDKAFISCYDAYLCLLAGGGSGSAVMSGGEHVVMIPSCSWLE